MPFEVKNNRFRGEFREAIGLSPPPSGLVKFMKNGGGVQGLIGAEPSPPGHIPVYASE